MSKKQEIIDAATGNFVRAVQGIVDLAPSFEQELGRIIQKMAFSSQENNDQLLERPNEETLKGLIKSKDANQIAADKIRRASGIVQNLRGLELAEKNMAQDEIESLVLDARLNVIAHTLGANQRHVVRATSKRTRVP